MVEFSNGLVIYSGVFKLNGFLNGYGSLEKMGMWFILFDCEKNVVEEWVVMIVK